MSRKTLRDNILSQGPVFGAAANKISGFRLTPRQEEISKLVMCGLSNRQISERLFITEQTVKDHLLDIFVKVGVNSRTELTAKFLGLDLDKKF